MGGSTAQTQTQASSTTGAQAGAGVGNGANVSGTSLTTLNLESSAGAQVNLTQASPEEIAFATSAVKSASDLVSQAIQGNVNTALETEALAKQTFSSASDLAKSSTATSSQQASSFLVKLGIIALIGLGIVAVVYVVSHKKG